MKNIYIEIYIIKYNADRDIQYDLFHSTTAVPGEVLKFFWRDVIVQIETS